jgi:hypothetical protein
MEQVSSDLRDAHAVMMVNITDILARLRARAGEVDLSQPFFFPPEHERFLQIITEFEQEREARVARYRRDKTKFRRYQEMMRGQNIMVVPRLKEADHPAFVQPGD